MRKKVRSKKQEIIKKVEKNKLELKEVKYFIFSINI